MLVGLALLFLPVTVSWEELQGGTVRGTGMWSWREGGAVVTQSDTCGSALFNAFGAAGWPAGRRCRRRPGYESCRASF